ncbi:MAG: DMT family transporter [Candidatus Bathyarchaeia archaeon]
MRKRSCALFTLMVLIWSSNWTVMKVGLKFVGPLNLVAQRLLLASGALLPILVWKRKNLPRDSHTWLRLVILSLINAIGMASTNIGLLYESSGLSSLLTYTQPLFVFCLATLFLNEEINGVKVLGVMIGFMGVATLYIGKFLLQAAFSESFPFLILGAFLWAVTVIYYKRFLSHVEPAIVNVIQFPVGSAFLVPLASIMDGLTFSWNVLYLFSILYISLLGSAVASTIWLLLLRDEEVTVISTSSFIVPVVAVLFGWLFLGESIGYNSILSIILVLSGVYLVNKPEK